MTLDEFIGAKLRLLRLQRQADPEQIAASLEVSLETYIEFELGTTRIRADVLLDLCDYFDVLVTSFLEGYEDPSTHEALAKLMIDQTGRDYQFKPSH